MRVMPQSRIFPLVSAWTVSASMSFAHVVVYTDPTMDDESFSAPTAVAKPQAIVDFRGGEETEPASGWPKERFLTPEPVEDSVDPADEYKMP